MKKAQVLKANGEIMEIAPENGTDFSLQEMYRYCNCTCIQMVGLADGRTMIMDDEGKLKDDWQINAAASELYMEGRMPPADYRIAMEAHASRIGAAFITLGDPEHAHEVAGDVIVCPKSMIK